MKRSPGRGLRHFAGEDLHLGVALSNNLDQALVLEVTNSLARKRSIHLETLRNGRRSDELGLRDFLHKLVNRGLVPHHVVHQLLLHLPLGPLLLPLLTAGRGRGSLLLLGLLCLRRHRPTTRPWAL